ncbi:MAG: hypothetical protein AAFY11_16170, partial [Cyanobacteria bacterium J06641_5]
LRILPAVAEAAVCTGGSERLMERKLARLSLSRQPSVGSVDALILSYLQATAGDLQFPNERISLAVSTFWQTHAYQAANYSESAIRQEVHYSLRQGQLHRDHLQGLCEQGHSSSGHLFGLHLPEPLPLTDLPLSGYPAEVKEFRIPLGEAGNTRLDALCLYLNCLPKSERRLQLLQALRGFWFPSACKHYGLKGQCLARAVAASITLLTEQFEHLRSLVPETTALSAPPELPSAALAPTPPVEDVEEGEDADTDGLDFSNYDNIPDKAESNGHVETDPDRDGFFENILT